VSKGYAAKEDVAKFLNREFTTTQEELCDFLIGAAEELIDSDYNISLISGGQQVESFYNPDSIVQISNAPVDNTQPIVVTAKYSFNSVPVTLAAGVGYELRNPKLGIFYFPLLHWDSLSDPITRGSYYSISITYSKTATVPSRVKLATCIIVAHYLRPAINDEAFGIKNYSDGELSIAFTDKVVQEGIPAEAERLLRRLGPTLAVR
jgi:hypothetical protein